MKKSATNQSNRYSKIITGITLIFLSIIMYAISVILIPEIYYFAFGGGILFQFVLLWTKLKTIIQKRLFDYYFAKKIAEVNISKQSN